MKGFGCRPARVIGRDRGRRPKAPEERTRGTAVSSWPSMGIWRGSSLLKGFPEIVWPLLGRAIVSERQRAWQLEQLLGDAFAFGDTTSPPLLCLPEDVLFAWCHAHLDAAPAFAARIVPVLTNRNPNDPGRTLHPIMSRLLDEFGNRVDVLSAVSRNMYSFGWSGSLATYFALYDVPLSHLETHHIGSVRRWAKKTRLQLRLAAEDARNDDDERDAIWSA